MYNIEFYEDSNGYSQLWEFLDDLQKKAVKSKDARIQHQQISFYIELLQEIPENSTAIDQRHNLNLSQRDLAEMCGLPHSSVARIESGKSSPNLTTLLKIFDTLGLTLSVQTNPHSRMSSAAK